MGIKGNTVGTTMPRSDWNQEDPKKADYIKNKPNLIDSPATPTSLGLVKVGKNLVIDEEGVLSVITADKSEEDNTKPITSAAVHAEIGNINALLESI